jgi:hypothetical protein
MSLLSRLFSTPAPASTTPSEKRTFVPRLELLEAREVLSTTYVVTNISNNANVTGSLPWAVTQAAFDHHTGVDYINFNIPGGGVHPIILNQTLFITSQVSIDARTQPGYNGTPQIYIEGTSNIPSLFLMTNDPSHGTTSSGSALLGMGMFYYNTNAVTILPTSTGNFIEDNWMGFLSVPSVSNQVFLNSTWFPQTAALGVQSSFNTIFNNTMSGTFNAMVFGENPEAGWSGTVYTGNWVTNNRVGTNPAGTSSAGYGNTSDAVLVGQGMQANYFGPNNVFSGNAVNAMEILGPSVQFNEIFRNAIGTDITGSFAIGNNLGILMADGANGNVIGGPYGGNIISGNVDGGIAFASLLFGAANFNTVSANIIGLNGAQTFSVGNQAVGVSITGGSFGNLVFGNVLAGNSQHGAVLQNVTGNSVSGNWIGENGGGFGMPNGAFGIALLSGVNFNFFIGNAFGLNTFGPFFVDPSDVGNAFA